MSSFGTGTQFVASLSPPGATALRDYDKTKRHDKQPASTPELFKHALAVREEVFVDEQKVPLDCEVDEEDERSWHWIVYASVASTTSPGPKGTSNGGTIENPDNGPVSEEEAARRSSSAAQRLPVGTIRLIPPPHAPNKYKQTTVAAEGHKHPDADPPKEIVEKHPNEPYIKLGRLAVLSEYRRFGLGRLLVNTAFEWAAKNASSICPLPSGTSMEAAKVSGNEMAEEALIWKGLCMVHAQTAVERVWAKSGFTEELANEEGDIEVDKEERWWEEGIEHMAMWKRIKLVEETGRL